MNVNFGINTHFSSPSVLSFGRRKRDTARDELEKIHGTYHDGDQGDIFLGEASAPLDESRPKTGTTGRPNPTGPQTPDQISDEDVGG